MTPPYSFLEGIFRTCAGAEDALYCSQRDMEVAAMKYVRQMGVILGFSFLGEVCRYLIPLPIPASIYGMVLLFLALVLKILPGEWVRDTGNYLVSILPLLFVTPTVGLLGCFDALTEYGLATAVIVLVSTVAIFAVSGLVTQALLRRKKGEKQDA